MDVLTGSKPLINVYGQNLVLVRYLCVPYLAITSCFMNILDINLTTTTTGRIVFCHSFLKCQIESFPETPGQASQSLPLITGSLLTENLLLQYVWERMVAYFSIFVFSIKMRYRAQLESFFKGNKTGLCSNEKVLPFLSLLLLI